MLVKEVSLFIKGRHVAVPVRSKYTIIQGNSGTGKSTFMRAVELNTPDSDLVIVLNYAQFVAFLAGRRKIGIMDEDFSYILSEDDLKHMHVSDKQFIIITRRISPELPVDYRDIYTFESVGKKYWCRRKYPNYDQFVESGTCIVEDTKSCYFYLKDKCSNVLPAGGASHIASLCTHSDITVIADGSAFGAHIGSVLETGVRLYLPISYEYLCVKHEAPVLTGVALYKSWRPEEFVSLERLFTAKLSRLTEDSRKYGLSYSKGKPQEWINRIPVEELFECEPTEFQQWLDKMQLSGEFGGDLSRLWNKYNAVFRYGKDWVDY